MDVATLMESLFGELKFYAGIKRKIFAEIIVRDDSIEIKIINIPVAVLAMVIHVLKKARISSQKLKVLKDAGYEITVSYGKIRFSL